MFNKRGETSWKTIGISLGSVAAVVLIIYLVGTFAGGGPSAVDQIKDSKKLGEVIGVKGLDFLSYFVGGIPQILINEVGEGGAVVIILALFLMILVTFGEIIATLGLFSKTVAWIISASLAVIAANLKGLMYLSVWAFSIVAGVGVLSVAVGILVPFLIFFLLNWGLLKRIKEYFKGRKSAEEVLGGLRNMRHGIRTLVEAGKATREQGQG